MAGTATTAAVVSSRSRVDDRRVDEARPRPPARRARTGSACSWCMSTADQVEPTVGGDAIGPSATTTVDSVAPPAHHARVAAEHLGLEPFEDGRPGDRGRRQLHTLAADPGDDELAFHRAVILWMKNSVLQASAGLQPLDQQAALDLTGGGTWQSVDHPQLSGVLEGGEPPVAPGPQIVEGRRGPTRGDDHHGAHHVTPPRIGQPDDRYLVDRVETGQYRLHLGRHHGFTAGTDARRRCVR